MTFYNFVVDTTTFRLSYSSIQFTVFGKIIDEPVSLGRIHFDGADTFYVDADVDSFTLLVSNMRGYKIELSDTNPLLYSKYISDYKYFVKQSQEIAPTQLFEYINKSVITDSDEDSDKYF